MTTDLRTLSRDELEAKLAAEWNDRPAARAVRAEIRRRAAEWRAEYAADREARS